MSPRAVSHDASLLVADGFVPRNGHIAHCRLERARQFGIHIAALYQLVGADLVYEAVLSIPVNNYLLWMRRVSCGFIFEIDVIRRDEDEGQNQRDHHVIVHAASVIGPENVALYNFADAHRLPFKFRGAAQE
jgi:hypothetical protein